MTPTDAAAQALATALRQRAEDFRRMYGNLGYYSPGDARLDEEAADALDTLSSVEAATLERAAKVAEDYDGRGIDEDYAALTCEEIAAAIRALKEQP